jgi:protocatechuate 3,4-dioxygenase beta subunit
MRSSFFAAIALLCIQSNGSVRPDSSDRFTAPPKEETTQIKTLIEKADSGLRSGKAITDILVDPDYLPAHEWPRFRKLIRESANTSRVTMVYPDEPGVPLVVAGTVRDQDGKVCPGRLLYAYQTSAKGWYSDRAAHVAANEGDRKHARLFGYLKTDEAGQFELTTIRPAGYPNSDLPAHIHIEVERGATQPGACVTELQFDDDPRLTAEFRARSKKEGFVIGSVKPDGAKSQRVEIDLKIR